MQKAAAQRGANLETADTYAAVPCIHRRAALTSVLLRHMVVYAVWPGGSVTEYGHMQTAVQSLSTACLA
jgi:hypothetical protein